MHWQYMTWSVLTCGFQRIGDKHGEVSDLKTPETSKLLSSVAEFGEDHLRYLLEQKGWILKFKFAMLKYVTVTLRISSIWKDCLGSFLKLPSMRVKTPSLLR